MKFAGGTFFGSKTTIYNNYITIVRFNYTYQGRKLISDTIGKILKQGACENTTNIRAFSETVVQYWNHIPNFIIVPAPLYKVVKKNISFEQGAA